MKIESRHQNAYHSGKQARTVILMTRACQGGKTEFWHTKGQKDGKHLVRGRKTYDTL